MKIKPNEKHFYYQESARSKQLTLEEYAIYCYLLQYVDKETGVAYPSIEMIYTDLNTTKKRVRKNLDSLKEKGFITWESGNSQKSNTYFFPKHYNDMKDKMTPIKTDNEENKNRTGTKLTPITGTNLTPITGVDLTPPKENIKENIKENNNNKKENDECSSFTNVQELSTPKENNVSNDTIQNIDEIDYEFINDIIYNENECIYENVDEENENQLSVTELIEIHGTDKDMIKSNPYAKQWIVNTVLSIIDYSMDNEKAQESIMSWIDKNDYLIWYFYQELNKHKYDYEFISSMDKEKRLNTLKSKLKKETQEWYERNESDEVEVYNGDYAYLYEF